MDGVTQTMRAIVQDDLGGPEVLHPATVDRPVPSIGQVLVRVQAAGVNPADSMYRQTGVFGGPPPFTLGWDVSGVVESVGPGVTLLGPGDEVFGLLPFPAGAGAYAEYVVAPTRALVLKPDTLTHTLAAALPLAGLTAWQSLVDTAAVAEGSRVLVTGAAGGVGHLAVQIATARGAHVVGLTSAEHEDLVRSDGADEVLDHRVADFADELRDLDVVLEVLGGDYPEQALRTLRPGGTLVSTLPQSLGPALATAAGTDVRVAGIFVEADRMGLTELVDLVARGSLVPRIAATYPMSEASTAHATKHAPGKVVLLAD